MTRILLNSNSTATILPTSSTSSSAKSPSVAEPSQAVDTDFVVILAALLCALICIVGLLSVVRCACARRGARITINRRSGGQTKANRGLKKKVVQSLPKYTYHSSSIGTGDEITITDCAICLAEYVDGDEIRLLSQCGHRFHVQCVDLWLRSHSSCPSCRQILGIPWCHKCGEFPPVSLNSQASTPAESSFKGGQHCETSSRSNNFLTLKGRWRWT